MFESGLAIDGRLARNLIAARTAAGWTQEALSAAARISRATIAQLETGSSDPRLSTIAALAQALNVPTVALLVGIGEFQLLAKAHLEVDAVKKSIEPHQLRRLAASLAADATDDLASLLSNAAERSDRQSFEPDLVQMLARIIASLSLTSASTSNGNARVTNAR